MTDTSKMPGDDGPPGRQPVVDQALADELLGRAEVAR